MACKTGQALVKVVFSVRSTVLLFCYMIVYIRKRTKFTKTAQLRVGAFIY